MTIFLQYFTPYLLSDLQFVLFENLVEDGVEIFLSQIQVPESIVHKFTIFFVLYIFFYTDFGLFCVTYL
jgi:hypothetical protein